MDRIFWRKAWGVFTVVVAFASLLVKFGVFHHAPPPEQPVMTTQQVYVDVCGHPDACKQMHDFMQYVEAEKKQMAAMEAQDGVSSTTPADPTAGK